MTIRSLLAAALLAPVLALAQEGIPPPPPPDVPPPPPPPGQTTPVYPPPAAQPVYPAHPVDSPPPAYPRYARSPYQRDSWYIGFGLGSGDGRISQGGSTVSLKDYQGTESPTNVSINFKLGATITPHLLVGLDISALRSAVDHGGGVNTAIQITNYDAMATWFPAGRGFFLRGGVGLSALTAEVNGAGPLSGTARVDGTNLTVGAGYAWWIGRSFNLTANLDFSGQRYGSSDVRPESSSFWNLWIGFDWY